MELRQAEGVPPVVARDWSCHWRSLRFPSESDDFAELHLKVVWRSTDLRWSGHLFVVAVTMNACMVRRYPGRGQAVRCVGRLGRARCLQKRETEHEKTATSALRHPHSRRIGFAGAFGTVAGAAPPPPAEGCPQFGWSEGLNRFPGAGFCVSHLGHRVGDRPRLQFSPMVLGGFRLGHRADQGPEIGHLPCRDS